MADDWRTGLTNRYPEFFREGHGSPSVGDGWRDLLERALARIKGALAHEPADAQLEIVQIKQKFGTLRLYFTGKSLSPAARAAVQEAVDLAEARSECSCEQCGDEGALHLNASWYVTYCEKHAAGDRVVVKPGWRRLRLVRGLENCEFVIKSSRLYDRTLDRFMDVPVPDDRENT